MKRIALTRRNLFQLLMALALVGLGVLMFFIGKQHVVLLDNKTIEADGKTYQAFSIVEVEVDKEGMLELAARDRDKAEVMAQRHTVTVRYTDKAFQEHELVKKFTIPTKYDMVLLSVPALVGGADQSVWLQLYIPPTAAVAPQQEPVEAADDLGVDLGNF